HQNAVLLAQRGLLLSETLAQVHNGNNLAAKIDHALEIIRRIGHGSDLRYPHDFVQGSDGHAIGLAAHLKTHDMKFTAHMFSLGCALLERHPQYCAPAAARRALPRPKSALPACPPRDA